MPLPERQLISRLRGEAGGLRRSRKELIQGIGGDCAVLRIPRGHDLLVTTDFSLEGVHFRREWHSPESVGHRCLTRGLSDIAAMGGEPVAAFLSLAVPANLPQNWIDRFLNGFLRLATQFSTPLAGGDTAESREGVLADVVVTGSVPQGKAILRSGARPGDRIYVTGKLGASAAILDRLYANPKRKLKPRYFPDHFFPIPRINIGKILRERNIASSMIDISDGLSTDLSHICEESGVGAELWSEAIPRATIAGRRVDLQFAVHGGDAYELLFTAKADTNVPAQIGGIKIVLIGEITRTKKLTLIHPDQTRSPLETRGWQHFQRPSPHK